MGRMRIAFATGLALSAACTTPAAKLGTGSVDLVLSLPPTGTLRPTGMTTVAVTVTEVGGESTVSTTPLETSSGGAMTFSTGDVTVGTPITLTVELRDTTNRVVGYGASSEAITPTATGNEMVTIPVRKPFVYVASDMPPLTLDPTIDASSSAAYQGMLSGSAATAASVIVSVDGTEMAVLTATTLTRVGTTDHKVIGSQITIPGGGVTDAAVVSGERRIVAAGASGLVLIDIDAGTATVLTGSPARPDRVAVGVDTNGVATAYALVGRVAPPTGYQLPADVPKTCPTTASSVTAVPVDGGAATPIANTAPLADIAANATGVFGANPCAGTVSALLGSGTKTLLTLQGASTIAIQGDRLWAAGSIPPVTGSAPQGSAIVLASIGTDGTAMQQVTLPPKAEPVTYTMDQANELSLNLHADTEVALDLAVLPGGDYVALLAQQNTHRVAEYNVNGPETDEVIPEMDETVYDIDVVDPTTGSLAQRVRAKCTLTITDPTPNQDEFPTWQCGGVDTAETPIGSPLVPTAITALYGAR